MSSHVRGIEIPSFLCENEKKTLKQETIFNAAYGRRKTFKILLYFYSCSLSFLHNDEKTQSVKLISLKLKKNYKLLQKYQTNSDCVFKGINLGTSDNPTPLQSTNVPSQ